MFIKRLVPALFVSLLFVSLPARAGFFVGADYTGLGADVQTSNGSVLFTPLNPIRVRGGYSWGLAGLEFDYLSPSDHTTFFSPIGDTNFEIESGYGVYLNLQERWAYGRLGATWLNTKLTDTTSGITNTYTTFAPTIAIGVRYEFVTNFWVNLDYTWMEGKAEYPSWTGTYKDSVTVQGPGLGLTYSF